MGNRKLPFGYQMRMGEIVRNEPEAKAVQDIFLEYSTLSYLHRKRCIFQIFLLVAREYHMV